MFVTSLVALIICSGCDLKILQYNHNIIKNQTTHSQVIDETTSEYLQEPDQITGVTSSENLEKI